MDVCGGKSPETCQSVLGIEIIAINKGRKRGNAFEVFVNTLVAVARNGVQNVEEKNSQVKKALYLHGSYLSAQLNIFDISVPFIVSLSLTAYNV